MPIVVMDADLLVPAGRHGTGVAETGDGGKLPVLVDRIVFVNRAPLPDPF